MHKDENNNFFLNFLLQLL